MKVSVSPRIVTLELTEAQAEVLCALLGGVQVLSDDLKFTEDLFRALDKATPNRESSFSDLFGFHDDGFVLFFGPDPV